MKRHAAPAGWWLWIAGGVAWGLVCVGVRHGSLVIGGEMRELLAVRNRELARVQALERRVADSRGFESMERRAAAAGFIRPPAGRVVVVPADAEPGLLARWFGPPAGAAPVVEPLPIRPREDVVTTRRTLRSAAHEARREAAAREARSAASSPARGAREARRESSRPARKPAAKSRRGDRR